jgi:hypothetical protein
MSKCSDGTRTGKDHQITITLSDGKVTVSQSEVDDVCVNDTITWTCEANAWAVQFVGEGKPKDFQRDTPPIVPLHVAAGAGESASVTVQKNAAMHKVWDYVVAVWDGSAIQTLDPEIVIGGRP